MSHTPPPFTPPAPAMRRDKGPMIILFIILGLAAFCIIGIVVAGFLGFSFFKKTVGPMAGCMLSFQATRDAVLDYARQHDGKLPSAATWQDDIKDIVKKKIKEYENQMFETISPEGDWGCKFGENKMTGMAFNLDLSGKKLADIKDPFRTPLIFEIEAPKRNAAERYSPRPQSSSPTLFGEHRGWVVAHVEGEIDLEGGAGRWRATGEGTPGAEGAESSKSREGGF